MALRFYEGFELSYQESHLQKKYDFYDGPTTTAQDGRLGGNSQNVTRMRTRAFATQDEWYIGFGVRFPAISNFDSYVDVYLDTERQCSLVFTKEDTTHMRIDFHKDRAAAALSTGSTGLIEGTWYFIELYVKVKDGVNGAYEVRINEVKEFEDTSADIRLGSADGANLFEFTGESSDIFTGWLDDIYICDTTGTGDCTQFLGDAQIVGALIPSSAGNGDETDWTPSAGDNYACVNEPANQDHTLDYVSSNTTGHQDLYVFDDVEEVDLPGEIRAIALVVHCALEATGTRKFKFLHKSATGINVIDDEKTLSGTGEVAELTILEDDPETSAPWELPDFNASQFGYEVVAT